jgi:hypothetical protein
MQTPSHLGGGHWDGLGSKGGSEAVCVSGVSMRLSLQMCLWCAAVCMLTCFTVHMCMV